MITLETRKAALGFVDSGYKLDPNEPQRDNHNPDAFELAFDRIWYVVDAKAGTTSCMEVGEFVGGVAFVLAEDGVIDKREVTQGKVSTLCYAIGLEAEKRLNNRQPEISHG